MASSTLRLGTYVAEQVASSSFDILNVTQSGFDRAPVEKVQGAASPGGGRRRKPPERGNFKATILPALVSIDPLLQPTGEEVDEKMSHSSLRERQEFERWHRAEELRISSARLHRGKPSRGQDRLPLTDRPMTRGDATAIAALTQPLPWFSQQQREASDAELGKRGKRIKAATASELFRIGLRGTELEHTKRVYSPSSSMSSLRPKGDELKLTLTEQFLVPEDPVEAYFTAEAERRAQQEEEARLAEHKKGKKKLKSVLQSTQMAAAREEVRKEDKSPPTFKQAAAVFSMKSVADVVVVAAMSEEKEKANNPHRYLSEVIDQLYPKQKVNPIRRELCQMMRLFVLGSAGNDSARGKKAQESLFYQARGTKADMYKLMDAWDKIDVESHSTVNAADLRSFGDRIQMDVISSKAWTTTVSVSGKSLDEVSGRTRLPGWLTNTPLDEREKFAQRLCERMGAVLLNPRKAVFRLEDIMRLVWCGASIDDLKQMREWCDEISEDRDKHRCSPPPVLPDGEKIALQAVFQSFDADGGGSVSASELIASGLMDMESARKFISEIDQDGSGEIDMEEFCELMCPHGFRARDDSIIGSTPLGQNVKYDAKSDTWRLKEAPPLKSANFAERLTVCSSPMASPRSMLE